MAYATVTEMRGYLTQVPPGAPEDAKLQDCLDRATATIEGELGFKFEGYAAQAATRRFDGGGSAYLHLPYHQSGSLAAASVKPVSSDLTVGTAFTYYEADADDHTRLWRAQGWPRGRYEAVAKWGYGLPPADIKQVVMEVAINLWLGSQGGQFSDVVGFEGAGAVGYNRALTNRQRMIIQNIKLAYGLVGMA